MCGADVHSRNPWVARESHAQSKDSMRQSQAWPVIQLGSPMLGGQRTRAAVWLARPIIKKFAEGLPDG